MIIYRGDFDINDCFVFWQSCIGRPSKDGNDLLIPTPELWIDNHPINNDVAPGCTGIVARGILRFKNVLSSVREESEFIGKGEFGNSVCVDDGPFNSLNGDADIKEYNIESYMNNPRVSFGWIVKAESFEFECEGVYDLKLIPEGCEYLNYRTIEEAIKSAPSLTRLNISE